MAKKKDQGGVFGWFLSSEVAGSAVLLTCAIAALVWANSPWADVYQELIHTYLGVSIGDVSFKLSLEHWVGDGLMVIFFFVVGLEIKREVVLGELSEWRNAVLPASAAAGGMLVPALFYYALNAGGPGASGWGVPMATDIAFALGILALFGDKVPIGLKVFLTALAIVDDLGAVLVIALFYTDQIAFEGLILAAACLAVLVGLGRSRIRAVWFYLIFAFGVWAGVLMSGVHATIAGVLLALVIPVRPKIDPGEFLERARGNLDHLEGRGLTKDSLVKDPEQFQALEDIYLQAEDMRPAGLALEHALHPVQAMLILPIFALFKAGVPLGSDTLGMLGNPITLGIIAGLIAGKQIGVLGAVWLAVKSGWTQLPSGCSWWHMWGASCLAGVGFTMSIFISDLAFADQLLIAEAKVGVLIASVLAGIIGILVLRKAVARPPTAGNR